MAPIVDRIATVSAHATNAATGMAEKSSISAEKVCSVSEASGRMTARRQDGMLVRKDLEAIARLIKPLRGPTPSAGVSRAPAHSLRRSSSTVRASPSSRTKLVSLASASPIASSSEARRDSLSGLGERQHESYRTAQQRSAL